MTNVKILYSFDFQSPVGWNPEGIVMDADGNVFGTAYLGGTFDKGTIFELAWNGASYASAANAVWEFSDSSQVSFHPIVDAQDNVYGTTEVGGVGDNGTVFELVKTSTGYTKTILSNFSSGTGGPPAIGGVVMDAAGNLFGTSGGGLFEIAKMSTGYASTPTVLSSSGLNNLVIDADGNLFGTGGGSGAVGGDVYEIPKTATGYASTPILLGSFFGSNGLFP